MLLFYLYYVNFYVVSQFLFQLLQVQMSFNLENKKSFTRHECWNIVKQTPKYKVLPIGSWFQLNNTSLHESTIERVAIGDTIGDPY